MKAIHPYHLLTRFAFGAIGLFMITLFACTDKEPPLKKFEPNPDVVNFMLFQSGSWWAFEDSSTLKKDTLILSSVSTRYFDEYEARKPIHTNFNYNAKLYQTSTNRNYSLNYNSAQDYTHKGVKIPVVALHSYNNTFGKAYELIFFNTQLNDSISTHIVHDQVTASRHFVLQEKGTGISILGKTYDKAYSKIFIRNSVAYDINDLELWLIENVGFAHHNMGGNYYLVNHSATNIVP